MKGSLSEKASKISIILVVSITIGKFIAYLFSNSLTVYSEAWHGFSDLFTTVLIFIAIKLSNRKTPVGGGAPASPDDLQEEKDSNSKKPEILVAFFIGFILLYISTSIMYGAIFYTTRAITYPLVTGITFIVFSFTSYFLYKFQTRVGKLDNSVALIADGQHSRSDMITSLITGISLILNTRGIDIDRYSAFLLSIVIFIFAIQLIITTFKSVKYNKSLASNLFEVNKNKIPKKLIYISLIISLFFLTSYNIGVKIPTGYQGIKLRFGKKIEVLNPGGYMKFPAPIDKIILINVKKVNTINIGNVATGALIWTKKHSNKTIEMITGDNNFIVPYIKVNYNIKNVSEYYSNYRNPDKLISDIVNQALTLHLLSSSFDEILLNRKWIKKLSGEIQKKLDNLKLGIDILSFSVQDIHPPRDVSLAFENLVAIQQELLTLKNRAESYKNLKLNSAKTEALQIITDAKSNGNNKINEITGKNIKDNKMADIFNKYKEIVKKYIYLDMISNTIVKNRKILVDDDANIELRLENKGSKK